MVKNQFMEGEEFSVTNVIFILSIPNINQPKLIKHEGVKHLYDKYDKEAKKKDMKKECKKDLY